MTDEIQPTILGEVIATGTAVVSKIGNLGALIEKHMVDAINKCYSEGITDAESILAAKMAAMERAKEAFENMVKAEAAKIL